MHDYLLTSMHYDFLWKEDRQNTYKWFAQTKPTIEDFERELQKYVEVRISLSHTHSHSHSHSLTHTHSHTHTHTH